MGLCYFFRAMAAHEPHVDEASTHADADPAVQGLAADLLPLFYEDL